MPDFSVPPTHPTFSTRSVVEEGWAAWQPFLEHNGYMLRRRYHPGWVSEAQTTGKGEFECEDSSHLQSTKGRVLDATRISDGMQVILKFVETASEEAAISAFLTNEPRAEKHTLPVLQLIPLSGHPELVFMVMPRMRLCDEDLFGTVGEFVEFLEQIWQGLVFLHSQNVAHRSVLLYTGDINMSNIFVDASPTIPGGFHFIRAYTSDGVHDLTRYRGDDSQPRLIKTRTDAGPMKYYYTDFELAVHFPSFEARGLVTGYVGHLRNLVPELSDTVPYDPFKVDVRLVGEMVWMNHLLTGLQWYDGIDFLAPFAAKLRHRSPKRRPDAEEALRLFRQLVSKFGEKDLTTPLQYLDAGERRKRWASLFLKRHGFNWFSTTSIAPFLFLCLAVLTLKYTKICEVV
ncbi:hypothetical protein B0H17DRAFT_940873 [Mycena rosella]|uniref:Protein kinase domain-containing protein n=1 Tax=Mycena rosella TaxID=1033263 RepID=A0AAD7D8W4_MYCRO|nr:hypothetical protein B0H17DRAFT_940873 [Mycena rosella]